MLENFYNPLIKISTLLNLYAPQLKEQADAMIESSGQYINYGLACINKNEEFDYSELSTRMEDLTLKSGRLLDQTSATVLKFMENSVRLETSMHNQQNAK